MILTSFTFKAFTVSWREASSFSFLAFWALSSSNLASSFWRVAFASARALVLLATSELRLLTAFWALTNLSSANSRAEVASANLTLASGVRSAVTLSEAILLRVSESTSLASLFLACAEFNSSLATLFALLAFSCATFALARALVLVATSALRLSTAFWALLNRLSAFLRASVASSNLALASGVRSAIALSAFKVFVVLDTASWAALFATDAVVNRFWAVLLALSAEVWTALASASWVFTTEESNGLLNILSVSDEVWLKWISCINPRPSGVTLVAAPI